MFKEACDLIPRVLLLFVFINHWPTHLSHHFGNLLVWKILDKNHCILVYICYHKIPWYVTQQLHCILTIQSIVEPKKLSFCNFASDQMMVWQTAESLPPSQSDCFWGEITEELFCVIRRRRGRETGQLSGQKETPGMVSKDKHDVGRQQQILTLLTVW